MFYLKFEQCYKGAGYKTLHKIVVRSYKQPFGGKNLKKRGLITDHFLNGNLKWGLIKGQIWENTFCRGPNFYLIFKEGPKKKGLINSQIWKPPLYLPFLNVDIFFGVVDLILRQYIIKFLFSLSKYYFSISSSLLPCTEESWHLKRWVINPLSWELSTLLQYHMRNSRFFDSYSPKFNPIKVP